MVDPLLQTSLTVTLLRSAFALSPVAGPARRCSANSKYKEQRMVLCVSLTRLKRQVQHEEHDLVIKALLGDLGCDFCVLVRACSINALIIC